MIFSDHSVRVWLYQQATDMRKSFKGLVALVKTQLKKQLEHKKAMTWPELQWLIDGIEIEKISYRKRYKLPG